MPPVVHRCFWFGTLLLSLPLAGCGSRAHHDAAAGFNRSTTTLAGADARLREVVLLNNRSSVRYEAPAGDVGGPARAALPIVAYRKLCSVSSGEDLGLASPTLSVSVERGSSGPSVMSFGNRNFTGAGVYTAIRGDPCPYLTPVAEVERLAALVDEQSAHALYGPTGPPLSALVSEQDEQQDEHSADNPWLSQSRQESGK